MQRALCALLLCLLSIILTSDRMRFLGANKNKVSVPAANEKRKVAWIQERPNVWRVVYAD